MQYFLKGTVIVTSFITISLNKEIITTEMLINGIKGVTLLYCMMIVGTRIILFTLDSIDKGLTLKKAELLYKNDYVDEKIKMMKEEKNTLISQAERTITLVKLTNALGIIEKEYKYKGSDGKEVSVKLSANPITLYSEEEQEQGVKNDTLSLDLGIVNQKAVYPSTGGIGSLIFAIVGAGLMTAAYIEYKRKKVIE